MLDVHRLKTYVRAFVPLLRRFSQLKSGVVELDDSLIFLRSVQRYMAFLTQLKRSSGRVYLRAAPVDDDIRFIHMCHMLHPVAFLSFCSKYCIPGEGDKHHCVLSMDDLDRLFGGPDDAPTPVPTIWSDEHLVWFNPNHLLLKCSMLMLYNNRK